MSIIDLVVFGLLAYFILSAYYHGFTSTLISIGAFILSVAFALLFSPLLSRFVKSNASLYSMALYYTEGSEFVGDVALAKADISSISTEQINGIIERASLPVPMGLRISQNIAKEAFVEEGITTLGDYFNQTLVNVFINILSLIVLFVIIRLLFEFVIRLVEYSRKGYPQLFMADSFIGAGFGLVHAFLMMYMLFLVTPIILIVMPPIAEILESSFFGRFFYNSNFLLRLISGV